MWWQAPQLVAPNLVLGQLRCSGTLEAVQLIGASYPTRIPYEDIYGRYREHMPDFVQELDPPEFTAAIALACDVDESDFQLGRTKLFCRPGKGAFLEELKERDLSEVIPILVQKIKEWKLKKVCQLAGSAADRIRSSHPCHPRCPRCRMLPSNAPR